MIARLSLAALALAFSLSRCSCDGDIRTIRPTLGISPDALDFGKVKVGEMAAMGVDLSAQSRADVKIGSTTLSDGAAPGGASAFEVVGAPSTVAQLSTVSLTVRFRPTALRAYGARLVLSSDDPQRPTVEVPIAGEGAHPILEVTADCSPSRGCRGTAVANPASIDFGAEPRLRAVEIPILELPRVTIRNLGEVPLAITALELVGPEASAFRPEAPLDLPGSLPSGQPALILEPGSGVDVPIRFKPFDDQRSTPFNAEMVVQSDDPTRPEERVPLTGTARPNLPPVVCANIISVTNSDGAVRSYNAAADWAPLIPAPSSGYDFSQSRDIEPGAEVRLSATSDSTNARACTTDPEDERVGLQYQWAVTKAPDARAATRLQFANTATPTLRLPRVTGEYELSLTVTDRLGPPPSTTTVRFTALIRKDLVVELSWNGQAAVSSGIDLDLHLVRPSSVEDGGTAFSGAFSYDQGRQTFGDINGVAKNGLALNPAFNFDWGDGGIFDDPNLNFDDTGNGDLIETISLNGPENDAACSGAPCAYKVLVHYFADRRGGSSSAMPCTVQGGSGCVEGDACDCPAGLRCVAAAAPQDGGTSGPGKCFTPPEPVVRIFLKANPVPAAVIPVAPQQLFIGAPCQTLYVADVVWPAAGSDGGTQIVNRSPNPASPVRTRFGWRAQGNQSTCTPEYAPDVLTPPPWFLEEQL